MVENKDSLLLALDQVAELAARGAASNSLVVGALRQAHEAISTLPIAVEGKAPQGWQLVPVKPTMEMVKNAAGDHEGENWLPHSLWASMLAAAPVPPSSPGKDGGQEVEAVELDGIAKELAEESGFWRSCSGCHNLNEGVPTGPYSSIMKCHLGFGCRECGGIGAIWDNVDYSDFGLHEINEAQP